jgi:hypothetical protein
VSTWRRHSIRTNLHRRALAATSPPLLYCVQHILDSAGVPVTTVLGFLAGYLPTFVLLDMSFTAVKIHVTVFGIMIPCSLVGGYKPFGQKLLHLEG